MRKGLKGLINHLTVVFFLCNKPFFTSTVWVQCLAMRKVRCPSPGTEGGKRKEKGKQQGNTGEEEKS